jgi:hypothetical protein
VSRFSRFHQASVVPGVAQPRRAQPLSREVAQPKAQPNARANTMVIVYLRLSLTLALVTSAGVSACSKSQRPPPDGGGLEVGFEGAPPAACQLTTICDGNTVRRCDLGLTGPVIEDCGTQQRCSRGRCTSPACASVEQNATFAGCLFYAADVANVSSEISQGTTVLVTNLGAAATSVYLQLRQPEQAWMDSQSITVDPGGAGSFTLPNRQFGDAGKGMALGYRLVSDAPVSVMVIQSNDSSQTSTSSAGTLILPVAALGQTYMVTTFPQVDTPKLDAVPGSRGGAGSIAIVGTQDGTMVTIIPSASATAVDIGGGIVLLGGGPNQRRALPIDDGDLYQIFSAADGVDLSGSQIVSDKPVVVFSGNISTTYGSAAPGINSPDLANEQLLPVSAWSSTYVAAWLPPQAIGCGSLLGGPGTGRWRIVASTSNTNVSLALPPQVTVVPPSNAFTLVHPGDVYDLVASGAGDFTIKADHAISVMQGMDCEPTLSSAVAVDALLPDLLFALPANFDHELAVVRPVGGSVQLDGGVISDAQFAAAGPAFEVARIAVPACYGASPSCVHRLQGKFGVTMRGMDDVCSYALTAPTWIKCLDTGPGCAN